MLYLFHGTDYSKARAYSEKFLEKLFLKKPDAVLVEMDSENFSQEKCEECVVSRGLFERYIIATLGRVLENKEAEAYLLERLELLARSENVFLCTEGVLPKSTVLLFQTHAKKIWSFGAAREKKSSKKFNAFLLADAVGRRDKRKAWILLQEAVAHDVAYENIHGILFWHIKTMLSIKKSEQNGGKAVKALGLKPFVLQKNRSFCRNYSLEELKMLSSRLVYDYHEARHRGPELPVALERFVLEL